MCRRACSFIQESEYPTTRELKVISKFEDDAPIQELLESIDDEVMYLEKLIAFYEEHCRILKTEVKKRKIVIERIRRNCVEEDD